MKLTTPETLAFANHRAKSTASPAEWARYDALVVKMSKPEPTSKPTRAAVPKAKAPKK
jgi:hypothetical protein